MQSNQLLTPKEKQVLDSQREIDWLKRQIQQYEQALEPAPEMETMLSAGRLEDLENLDPIESNKDVIDELREKLDVMTQFNLSKDALTEAIDATHNVLKSLYPGQVDHDSFERSRAVKIIIEERDNLTSLFLTGLEQLRKVKNELAQTQARIIESHQENRELVQSIRDIKEQIAQDLDEQRSRDERDIMDSQISDQTDRISDYKYRLEIARNVLMGIILESGIEWTTDDHYLQVMQEIGDETED
ncbi:hypothetical protein BDA99DRAFT_518447 [Phascolomyces articulosus]|uniref:Centromere protein H C-terminal domain-containing protein n=1 Tax=Phascolomyces articulosus TaxID=60185 RepID=A0AAD5PAY4_9FUNG|nr:hypothetical protein BDA99DRAFT_518447 [Phascolomyces articulosus]